MEVNVERPKKLYRYSERKWLERALKFGEFRLRPASDYLVLEAAAARQDDERNRMSVRKKGTFVMTLERTGEIVETLGDVMHTRSIDVDYLMLCFSTGWDPLLIEEFEGSDACLIINEPSQFLDRIHDEIEKRLSGWRSLDAPVSYGKNNPLGVAFSKPERYLSQAEHRLVVAPPSYQVLEPTLITIGSIESIAEIVTGIHSA